MPRRINYWNRGWNFADAAGGKMGRLYSFAIRHGDRDADNRRRLVNVHYRWRRATNLGQGTSGERESLSHPAGVGIDRRGGDHRCGAGDHGCGGRELLKKGLSHRYTRISTNRNGYQIYSIFRLLLKSVSICVHLWLIRWIGAITSSRTAIRF